MMDMKKTGMVRCIDDLGRVAIPKEIRRSLHIHAGDSLEVYVTDGGILFKPYNEIPQKDGEAQDWLRRNKYYLDAHCVRFSIEGNVTTCEGILDNQRVTGSATCKSGDTFSPAIGMVYACCRAFELAAPDGWS